uniref:Uncharacterized protein n=1 Tax=Candidatus Kentrum sp. DK TaxID=2126562 RepID=A0A450RTX3_9GAMM|nr:MAG: hypothetical protein BECKDK2373C_GA0170839_100174 [Candidatus Kentron sp. DK]VFJ59605.1 MAG: hypothetical protein BECKDK2373B_GA0170837_108412 [Candidatus Kentron sp. DK]
MGFRGSSSRFGVLMVGLDGEDRSFSAEVQALNRQAKKGSSGKCVLGLINWSMQFPHDM